MKTFGNQSGSALTRTPFGAANFGYNDKGLEKLTIGHACDYRTELMLVHRLGQMRP